MFLNPQARYGFYNPKVLKKLCVITFTRSSSQEVLEYALEYVSIFYVQKLYQVHDASNDLAYICLH